VATGGSASKCNLGPRQGLRRKGKKRFLKVSGSGGFENLKARSGEHSERSLDSEVQQNESGADAALPCLYSHISTETPCFANTESIQCKDKVFTTGRKRSAFILAESVEQLAFKHGLNNLGFLTLTFSDHVLTSKVAQSRLNSLISHVIKPRYGDYVGVLERQKSGRIHYHLLVVVGFDIRTGVDFDELRNSNYRSAGEGLRREWAFWRSTARKYRFGRTELMPVKSSATAIKFYIGKYISKSFFADADNLDKGVRLVRYSRGARAGTTRFAFVTDRSEMWREAVGFFAELLGDHIGLNVNSIEEISEHLGPRWAYKHREFILGISEIFSTLKQMGIADFREQAKSQISFDSKLPEIN
jgi:hypothetical protein